MSIIKATLVTKRFNEFLALDGLQLEINAGECFGLLGPNGAGKSTFINMLYGQVKRSDGELRVFNLDPEIDGRSIKERMGVVTQDNALDESLTVFENMRVYASFVGLAKKGRDEKILSLLEYLNLNHKKDASIRSLSGGMKRRLVFVRALLGSPEILILDEPTTGLDPAIRHLLWAKVQELKSQKMTILLTTHYIHEAEVLCDRIAILNKGKIIEMGVPSDLIKKHTPGYVGVFALKDKDKISDAAKLSKEALEIESSSMGIKVRVPQLDSLRLFYGELELTPLQIRPANLEDVFLKITGEELTLDD
jgi:lipooligosaccharide transport system ATP-binding protein